MQESCQDSKYVRRSRLHLQDAFLLVPSFLTGSHRAGGPHVTRKQGQYIQLA